MKFVPTFKAARNSALLMLAAGFSLVLHTTTAGAQGASGSIQSGPFELEYQIEGSGVPAIVIGFPNYYRRIFSQELRSHLRLVFVDHRGSASSPGEVPLSEFSLDKIVDDVELTRSELGLGQVVIIGHSGHALMALEFAKKYPSRVSHVIMIGISPDLGADNEARAKAHWDDLASYERKAALDRNWEGVAEEDASESFPGESFVRTYVRNGPLAWYDYEFDSTPLWKDVDANLAMIGHVWGTLLAELDISRGLKDLDRPVFLALGKYDFLVAPPSSWDSVRPLFRDLTLKVYEESGHTPPYEQANLFDADLLSWLTESNAN